MKFSVGDIVICTNELWPKDVPNLWPDYYLDRICIVTNISIGTVTVRAIDPKLIEYRNLLIGGNSEFDSDPEGFFNLGSISLNNKLLKLVRSA